MRRRLVVMAKEPRAGLVKTRLGREIGMVPAAWWMRHQLRSLLRRLRDPRWEVWLAVAPDSALANRAFPADLPRIAQGRGDLGDRMGRVLGQRPMVSSSHATKLLSRSERRGAPNRGAAHMRRPVGAVRRSPAHRRAGHMIDVPQEKSADRISLRDNTIGPTLIIGADIPAITKAHIWRAFRALGAHDAVIGPAPDGGYWLIGMKGLRPPPPRLFEGVRWSTPHALSDTLATLPGLRIAMVDTLADVDEAADL